MAPPTLKAFALFSDPDVGTEAAADHRLGSASSEYPANVSREGGASAQSRGNSRIGFDDFLK